MDTLDMMQQPRGRDARDAGPAVGTARTLVINTPMRCASRGSYED